MVDARLDDARDVGNKLLSKGSRWRTKYFAKDDTATSPDDPPKTKRADTFELDDDVNDFLKPSTQRAAAAFLAAKPRIDVARAQRWPGAQAILSSAAATARSPGPGGLRTGTRKRGLTVNFARTQPDVIGHGGDECEEPSLEVSRRKKASSVADAARLPAPAAQDDANLAARTPQFDGMARSASQTSQTSQTAPPRNSFTRTLTNQGEMPPLQKKLEMGNINTYAHPPPPAPQRMGPMGLGERPKVLSRAPTGFDLMQNEPPAARRPSKDSASSAYSLDSDSNASPVVERKAPVLPPTKEEDNDFRPNPLRRTQTGFTDTADDSDTSSLGQVPPVPQVARLPERRYVEQEDDSPLESRVLAAERFLQSEPTEPDSFSAKVKHRMRAEEGGALHEAQQRALEGKRDSDASSLQSDPFQVGTPPSTYNAYMGGRTTPSAPPPRTQGSVSHPAEPAFTIRPRQDISMRLGGSLAQSDTKMLDDSAFKDFAERVVHMKGIFQLTAQLGGAVYDRSPTQWARVATWWFLKGRAGMENLIRSRPKTAEPQQERLTQPHVDLAKAWWICAEVLPEHPGLRQYASQPDEAQAEMARKAGDITAAEAFEIKSAIFHYMKLLTGSMKKHQSMPPTQALIQEYSTRLAICSQNEDINLVVGSNSATGPTWKDISWKKQSRQLCLQLHHGFVLNLELNEGDWRNLWAIVDHTNRVESSMRERTNERFSCKLYLREASYKDPANPAAFPPERVHGCKLMVFEKFERSSEGTGRRKLHRGYRLVLVTAQKNKQLSSVEHELGTKQEPMNFEYVTENDQSPAMRLHFREGAAEQRPRLCSVHLVFQDPNDRNHLFGTFTSMNIAPGEMTFAQVPLKTFSIESADQADAFSATGSRVLEKLQWQEAKTVNQDPEAAGLEAAPTVLSESLRIVCRHTAGIISDRMNLGPGEILVRLPTDGAADLTLLRNPQQDMAVAVDSSRTDKGVPDALAELLRTLTNASTIRRLAFNSFKDLHAFQLAVTGFEVKFDGIASTFSISRRRMVVPIYKQWTANTIRLQIVHQDNVVQLLAFFEDFSHADAMNFRLSSMDTFEKKDSGGKFGLKLVDAKFALPVDQRRGEGKMQKAEGRLTGWVGTKRRFVCLDEIEYPGEHDDILIMFDSAEARDLFADALPAATMERKFTVRRKI
ncbi:hypothetical protein EJ07DRAFT_100036 [Lizonia empirigonia]|nr:hypothetical protein EJ07DRAFT_100036 [Lizonia empirigonia]